MYDPLWTAPGATKTCHLQKQALGKQVAWFWADCGIDINEQSCQQQCCQCQDCLSSTMKLLQLQQWYEKVYYQPHNSANESDLAPFLGICTCLNRSFVVTSLVLGWYLSCFYNSRYTERKTAEQCSENRIDKIVVRTRFGVRRRSLWWWLRLWLWLWWCRYRLGLAQFVSAIKAERSSICNLRSAFWTKAHRFLVIFVSVYCRYRRGRCWRLS